MTDEHYMQLALQEAQKAFEKDEVPIGAILVMQDKIIARAHNQVELLNDSTAHAEILALTTAFNFLGSKYLPEACLYVTVEPCLMCSGALYWSKIGRIVFGAAEAELFLVQQTIKTATADAPEKTIHFIQKQLLPELYLQTNVLH